MNKKDLLNFIERVESKAIKSVEEKWNKQIKAKKDEVFSKYKEKVRFNYKKVYMVSKDMSSAKKIAEYLEGLGFDISTLKEDEMKYLSTDIDKSKLFVCGENH